MNKIYTTFESSSKKVIFEDFGKLSTPITIWTPDPGKIIYLTAIESASRYPVVIILSTSNGDFIALHLSSEITSYSKTFSSPLKLTSPIMVKTQGEFTNSNAAGGSSIVQVPYDGRSDFITIQDALGLPNADYASLPSGLLTQTRGDLVLSYSILPTLYYQDLLIDKVIINFYFRIILLVAVGVSGVILRWRPNSTASWIQLDQIAITLIGTLDYVTVPYSVDITSAILAYPDPWAVIGTMQTSFVGYHSGLNLSNSVQLAAVVIQVDTIGNNKLTLTGYEV